AFWPTLSALPSRASPVRLQPSPLCRRGGHIEWWWSGFVLERSRIQCCTRLQNMEQIALNWGAEPQIYSVSELTLGMRVVLTDHFTDIWVSGEIFGTKLAASGHYYFTLKDESAQLRCVCYKMTARYLKFKPQDGVAVLARGRIDLYDARGELQFVVESLEPQGHGALQFAFEQLKKKLATEGLFDPE